MDDGFSFLYILPVSVSYWFVCCIVFIINIIDAQLTLSVYRCRTLLNAVFFILYGSQSAVAIKLTRRREGGIGQG
jgi:hypothetical protein